jgi:CBS domain-containing protein
MTRDVVTATPVATVTEVARLLVEHRVSALPVVDDDGTLVGIVSERDLIRRSEIAGERRPPWWLELVSDPARRAKDYVKTHGGHAGDVMTRNVVTVTEATPVAELARLLEDHRIKRAPVLRDGKLVGIVSRADLVRVLATRRAPAAVPEAMDDRAVQAQLQNVLDAHGWDTPFINVIVADGVVHLSGTAETRERRRALKVAAEAIPGVEVIESDFAKFTGWA